MSVEKFAEAFIKLLRPSEENIHTREAFSAVAEHIVDTSNKLEERSTRHKEERDRGARITKHRFTI